MTEFCTKSFRDSDYLCSLIIENKPAEKAISKALKMLAENGQWDSLKKILELRGNINQLSRESIESILEEVVNHYSPNWELVVSLCSLTTENKPGEEAIGKTLIHLANVFQWPLITKILQINDMNKPNRIVNENILKRAQQAKQLEVIQAICSVSLDSGPGEKSLEDALNNAAVVGSLDIVRFLCKIKTANNKPFHDDEFKKALEHTYDHSIKKCLLKAEMIFKLHKHIADLEIHGKKLLNNNESKTQGSTVVSFTKKLTTLTNCYASTFFDDQNTQTIRQQFSDTLQDGFKEMGNHRQKWKINLANIILAATGVGLLINYMISGHAFFFKTKRQDQIEKIMNDLGMLEGSVAENC